MLSTQQSTIYSWLAIITSFGGQWEIDVIVGFRMKNLLAWMVLPPFNGVLYDPNQNSKFNSNNKGHEGFIGQLL